MSGGIFVNKPEPTKWGADDPTLFYMDFLDVQSKALEISTAQLFDNLRTFVSECRALIESRLVSTGKPR